MKKDNITTMTWYITKDERGKLIGAPLMTDITQVIQEGFMTRVFFNKVQAVINGDRGALTGTMSVVLTTNEWFHRPLRQLVAMRLGDMVSKGSITSFHGEGGPTKRWNVVAEFTRRPGLNITEVAIKVFIELVCTFGVVLDWRLAPVPRVIQQTYVRDYIAADHEVAETWVPYGEYLANKLYPKKD